MSLTKTHNKTKPNSSVSKRASEHHENILYTVITIVGGILTVLGCALAYMVANPSQKRYEVLSSEAFKVTAPTPEAFISAIALLLIGAVLTMIGLFHFLDMASLGLIVILTGVLIVGDTILGAIPQNEARQAFNKWLNNDAHLSQVDTNTSKFFKNGLNIPVQEISEPVLMKTSDNKLVFVTFHNNENVITYTTKPAKP